MRKVLVGLVIGLVLGACAYIGAQTVGDAKFRNLTLTGTLNSATAVTPSSTVTFTNKTLNAESTGNVLTMPVVEWWLSSHCESGGGYGGDWSEDVQSTNGPSVGCSGLGSSNTVFPSYYFDDSATEAIYRTVLLPSDWTGAIDLKFIWFTTATSGNVVWQVATTCLADNENMDPATFTYNTAQTVTDAAKASTVFLNTASLSSITTTGCSAGELMFVKVFRNPAHASDTIGAAAQLIGVEATYRRAM